MFEKLKAIEQKFEDLERKLSDPNLVSNRAEYQKIAKEHSDLREIVETFRHYEKIGKQIEENLKILEENDEELREIVKEEIPLLKIQCEQLEAQLKILLLPKDPNDERNVFLEIRAGTGGDEAALFAADLFRMYARFAEISGWKVEIMSSSSAGGMGGFKEIIAMIEGKGAF